MGFVSGHVFGRRDAYDVSVALPRLPFGTQSIGKLSKPLVQNADVAHE